MVNILLLYCDFVGGFLILFFSRSRLLGHALHLHSYTMKMPMPTPMPTPTTASGHLRRAETRDLFALPPVSNTVNLGPLPTDFVPPRSCADWHMLRIDTFTDNGQKRSAIQYQLDIATAPACMPSSYADVYSKGSAPVFSTGKACPTGFQPACTMVGGDGGFNIGLSKWDALQPSETAIGCCQTYVIFSHLAKAVAGGPNTKTRWLTRA